MKVIYICGPYRGPDENSVLMNILAAREAAIYVWQHGGVAICPHLNTALMGGLEPDETWLKGDIELLNRSDALWAIDGWSMGEGAKKEVQYAHTIGIPVLSTHVAVKNFLEEESF